VIGAVAWAVLGPKELFRLAREAGEFLGQWQQLGQQARDQFTSALEQELAEDEANKKDSGAPEPSPWAQAQEAWGETSSPTSQGPPADSAPAPFDPAAPVKSVKYEVGSVPSLAEMAAQRAANNQTLTSEEEDALRASMYDTLGEPSANAANFAEQISGERNSQVLQEFPSELSMPSVPLDGSAMSVQSADEELLQTQIDQAENSLAALQAEKQVLALKRQQLEAKAARARELAEQRAEADVAAGQAAEGGAVASAAEGSATKSTESGAASA